jgi:hypothetical protein
MFKLPLAVPDALGVKLTSSVILCPELKVLGRALPVSANGLETSMLLIVIALELLFETDTD